MKCNNSDCRKEIPKARKSSAKYCCDECYYSEKKKRSKRNYERVTKPIKEILRNEIILAQLFQMQQLGKPVTGYDLEKLNFNFGISTTEYKVEKKYITKAIGQYTYLLEPSYNLKIWKISTPQ
jgi:hypothetical protein